MISLALKFEQLAAANTCQKIFDDVEEKRQSKSCQLTLRGYLWFGAWMNW